MRIGVLGAARITEAALIEPARTVEGVQVWSVAARDPERAAAYAGEHGIPHVFPTYDALLADPSVDAVYVPLANSLHARWATAALAAGKHVLCEKPLAANADQAATVVAAAAQHDRLLVEAFHWRYHPVAERMIELGRAIGPLTSLEASFSAGIPADDVRYDLAMAGGSLMDLGCYCLSMVRAVAGSEPRVVSADAIEGPAGIDLSMEAVLAFPDDLEARISCTMSGGGGPESTYLRARGRAGTMEVVNPVAPQWGHRITAQLDDGGSVDETLDAGTSYEHQLRAFARMVAGEQEPLTGGEEALATMRLIDEVYLASGLGRRPGR